MAYDIQGLSLRGSHNGFGDFRYDTLDTAVTVDSSGYFNNDDDTLNLAVGDMIEVVVWSSAIRSGTISDVENHIVVSVSAAGVVDISDPLNATTLADTD